MTPHKYFSAALVGMVSAVTVPAFADSTTTPAPSAPTPSAEQQEAARIRFRRGVELYEDGDYKFALIEFERAYETAPSYRMLYNIGQVRLELGHYSKAIRAFERYLRNGGDRIPTDRRRDVEREIAFLLTRTATLTIRVSVPDADVEIDSEKLGRSPLPVQTVDGGAHRVLVTRTGFKPQDQLVVLAGGDARTLDIALLPVLAAPPPVATSRAGGPGVWIAWTATGALASGAAVCGAFAQGALSDLKNLRDTAGSSNADRESASSRAHTFAITADVMGASALAAGVVAVYLMLRRPTAPTTRVGFGPMIMTGHF